MSWHRIVLPLETGGTDPKVVEIGSLGWACFERENKPAGFAMFHATEGSQAESNEKFIVYLSPVATELCKEVAESYTLEPCEVPSKDEPNIAYVFGDPLVMGQLRGAYRAPAD